MAGWLRQALGKLRPQAAAVSARAAAAVLSRLLFADPWVSSNLEQTLALKQREPGDRNGPKASVRLLSTSGCCSQLEAPHENVWALPLRVQVYQRHLQVKTAASNRCLLARTIWAVGCLLSHA